MPGVAKPAYPANLRRASWDKAGLLAKAAGKTGVGDAMDDAFKKYEAVDWELLKMLMLPAPLLDKAGWLAGWLAEGRSVTTRLPRSTAP